MKIKQHKPALNKSKGGEGRPANKKKSNGNIQCFLYHHVFYILQEWLVVFDPFQMKDHIF